MSVAYEPLEDWTAPVASDRVSDRAAIIDEICERLAEGEALAQICRDPGMPSAFTVWAWKRLDPQIEERISYAREIGEEAIALDVQMIVDGLKPVPGVIAESARDKARADVRLRLLAKFNPKRWGESTQLRHADADGQKLDTQPLVSELLNLMNGSAPSAGQASATVKAEVITPLEAPRDNVPRRPAYRPMRDVSDLV